MQNGNTESIRFGRVPIRQTMESISSVHNNNNNSSNDDEIELTIDCSDTLKSKNNMMQYSKVTPIQVPTNKNKLIVVEEKKEEKKITTRTLDPIDETKNNDCYLSILNGCLSTEDDDGNGIEEKKMQQQGNMM